MANFVSMFVKDHFLNDNTEHKNKSTERTWRQDVFAHKENLIYDWRNVCRRRISMLMGFFW
jgi:hypothetical protein